MFPKIEHSMNMFLGAIDTFLNFSWIFLDFKSWEQFICELSAAKRLEAKMRFKLISFSICDWSAGFVPKLSLVESRFYFKTNIPFHRTQDSELWSSF